MEEIFLLSLHQHKFDTYIWNADVLKVRLQMQLVGQKGPLTGMVLFIDSNVCVHDLICQKFSHRDIHIQGQLFVGMLKTEGPRSLYLGLTPALTRSVLYGGLRLGLYEPSKYACDWAFGSTNIFLKIASGGFSGAIATALTNPVEVLKVMLPSKTFCSFLLDDLFLRNHFLVIRYGYR